MSYNIEEIIKDYDVLVKGIETKANNNEDRAYGGIIRSEKGVLVENIAKRIIQIAWKEIGGKESRISLDKKTVKIPLNKNYLKKIKYKEVVDYIKKILRNIIIY